MSDGQGRDRGARATGSDAGARRTGAGGAWRVFELPDLLARKADMTAPYLEFLRVPSLSCGIYSLPAGSSDLQSPHDEDEVYFVISGKARLRINGEERDVRPGSILYVQATSEHSFFEIEEDITLLVFFASGGPSGAALPD